MKRSVTHFTFCLEVLSNLSLFSPELWYSATEWRLPRRIVPKRNWQQCTHCLYQCLYSCISKGKENCFHWKIFQYIWYHQIDTLELFYTADFVLSMRWRDPRLVWYDLRGATDLNSLDKDTQTKIWSPELSFTNAKIIGGSRVDSISSKLVLRVGKPAPDNIEVLHAWPRHT